MHRYLALVWDPTDPSGARYAASLESLIRTDQSWKSAYRNAGVLVVHRPPPNQANSVYSLSNETGVVIGSLFRRTRACAQSSPDARFDSFETLRVLDSGGRYLVTNYWGSYVAIVRVPGVPTTVLLR